MFWKETVEEDIWVYLSNIEPYIIRIRSAHHPYVSNICQLKDELCKNVAWNIYNVIQCFGKNKIGANWLSHSQHFAYDQSVVMSILLSMKLNAAWIHFSNGVKDWL